MMMTKKQPYLLMQMEWMFMNYFPYLKYYFLLTDKQFNLNSINCRYQQFSNHHLLTQQCLLCKIISCIILDFLLNFLHQFKSLNPFIQPLPLLKLTWLLKLYFELKPIQINLKVLLILLILRICRTPYCSLLLDQQIWQFLYLLQISIQLLHKIPFKYKIYLVFERSKQVRKISFCIFQQSKYKKGLFQISVKYLFTLGSVQNIQQI
ncbi:hypothetical protein TTHERM_000526669 (macronuclear) [Tetrahymena thermophila SB210]|uniref:Uncharacterized protein n=1 Tax=Tetrahymena thermophila (strain SB210) TaxID=312017 RepID=W7WVS0_TETTS|nr:hypothetical protein TTHERM_000526669 [Tetrahymena thermophila SB210]EWS70925.1 hypothetical protein TTHERM_000526669 [Tetrahymena thermophila SB210]|eukprot:XP_012656540.1 hypothetical protein TTHERM_000526669 [Tetrahymena thermophila SB210]